MWNAKEKLLLNLVLNELIPPHPARGIPGGGETQVADFICVAERYAKGAVDAAKTVLASVSRKSENFSTLSRAERITIIKEVEADQSKAFATLLRAAYMGYYSRAEIRAHFGLAVRPVHPEGYPVDLEDKSLMKELTAPVRARGPVYRNF